MAGICIALRTDLHIVNGGTMTVQRCRDDIIHTVVRPFAGAIGDDFMTSARRAYLEYLETARIETMEWPAVSPDSNPIEHMLGYSFSACFGTRSASADYSRRVLERHKPPQTIHGVFYNAISLRRLFTACFITRSASADYSRRVS